MGFRGEPPPKNFAQTLTILTVGGSTTECLHVSDGKAWPDFLARRLKEKFQPLWLNNAGMDGHSTFGHLVLMKDYIVQLKPKVVLFFVGVNDRALPDYGPLDKKSLKKPAANCRLAVIDNLAQYSEVANYAVNLSRYFKAHRLAAWFTPILTLPVENPGGAGRLVELNTQLPQGPVSHPLRPEASGTDRVSQEHAIEPVFMTQPIIYGEVIDPVSGADLGEGRHRGRQR